MSKDSLGFRDYLKAAFNLRVRSRSLGRLPLNKLLLGGFGILALGHPGFLFLGLAYETAYLIFLSGNKRFQNLVRGEKSEERGTGSPDQAAGAAFEAGRGSPAPIPRPGSRLCQDPRQFRPARGRAGLQTLQSQELSRLLDIFLKLLHARKTGDDILGQISESGLREEIRLVEERLAASPRDRRSTAPSAGTLEIQKRRLDNLLQIKESQKVTEAELDRIEKQVTLISEETALAAIRRSSPAAGRRHPLPGRGPEVDQRQQRIFSPPSRASRCPRPAPGEAAIGQKE